MSARPPANITSRGRRRRAFAGLIGLGAGGATIAWAWTQHLPWAIGLLTAPFFVLGTLGIVQASTST